MKNNVYGIILFIIINRCALYFIQINYIVFFLILQNIKDNSLPIITQMSSNYIKKRTLFREMKKEKPL